jgi:cobalt-zinc-cadmium efflux system outer membrane protein
MKRGLLSTFVLLSLILSGCEGRRASTGFEDIQNRVQTLIDKQVEWRDADVLAGASPADELLRQNEISLDTAVQIALLKNPSLQATFEELGIAEADVREAGYMKNPVFDGEVRFPNHPGAVTNTHFDLAFSFIDLILAPMRKRVEAMRFDATKTRLTLAVLNLVADVRIAYYQLQAEQSKMPLRKDALLGAEAASEFAQKLLKAGDMPELSVLPKIALHSQAKLDSARTSLEIVSLREKLSRLMGVPSEQIKDRIPAQLPAMPQADAFGTSEELESLALSARLDLEMQRQDNEIVDKARSLRHWGAFTAVQLGASTEKGPENVRVTGPTLQMELPVFNRGQADRMRLSAQLRQSQDKLAALELTVRSEVRETLAQLEAARATVEEYRATIGPLRAKAVDLAQKRYNSMTLSALDLLSAKQEQIGARVEEIEALRDYWTHRVELERAAGGRLPSKTLEAERRGKD